MTTASPLDHKSGIGAFYEDRSFWACCVLISAAFILSHAKLFAILVGSWLNSSVYSHGFLVPLISLYLVWEYRGALERISPSPSYLMGFILLSLGLALHLASQAAGILVIQEASLIITISGMVLFILGPGFLRNLAFPILYLSFMLTSWGIFTERLHMPFQLFSADLGTRLLHIVGVPAYLESVYIMLPDITLEVARECSGVNYLVSVAALGIPLAYLALKSWPRRVLLVSGALIVAVLANSLRVALIGVLSYHNFSGALHGPMHILHGMSVSVIGFAALFAGVLLLSEKRSPAIKTGAETVPADDVQNAARGRANKYPLFITVLMLFSFGILSNYYQPSSVKPKLDMDRFPDKIGEWSRVDEKPLRIVPWIGADHEVHGVYRHAGGAEMTLYVGYFEQQTQGKEVVNDQTKRLHAKSVKRTLTLTRGRQEQTAEVNVLAGPGREMSMTLFWYDLDGKIVDGRMSALAHTAWHGIARGRTNGAFVAVSSHAKDADPANWRSDHEEDFISSLIPVLNEYI